MDWLIKFKFTTYINENKVYYLYLKKLEVFIKMQFEQK